MKTRKTIVGKILPQVLAFTAGKDPELDLVLAEADCIGSAAHATMLSRLPGNVSVLTDSEVRKLVAELVAIMRDARTGSFKIRQKDQDVHLAVESRLTTKLGNAGRKIHTARSRNDQVAVGLRLYGKERLLDIFDACADLSATLLRLSRKTVSVPMVGRTHMQPAMPSSVGLWASAFAESLLDDTIVLRAAYDFNDRCPLGSAAGYGVSLPIDRALTAKLLGFPAAIHNVLCAGNSRGKCESVILSAVTQVMLTLSRLAEDLVIFCAPEFGYFTLPPEFCTGSSIMPQKHNPDVMELIRAKAFRVAGYASTVTAIVQGLPSGYNRDLQETKEPFLDGLQTTAECLKIMTAAVAALEVHSRRLRDGFVPGVYAADKALKLVGKGVPFRDAYNTVRDHLDELERTNPADAVAAKKHLGAPAGLDFTLYTERVNSLRRVARGERGRFHRAVSRLLGISYPELL